MTNVREHERFRPFDIGHSSFDIDQIPNIISPSNFSQHDRFAIVVSRWNEAVTRRLLDGALSTFRELGVADDAVDVAWVPGSWEIPLAAKRMADSGRYCAVLCLGA